MASAAAVAADIARSPGTIGDDIEQSNGVTSAVVPQDDADVKAQDEDEDEDDDITKRVRRGDRMMAKANGEDLHARDAGAAESTGEAGGDDLFGDEEDELPDDPSYARLVRTAGRMMC